MSTDFGQTSVALGLKFGAFSHLSEKDRKRLVKLMARIAEKSYRRGVQHGAVLSGDPMSRDELYDWRYRPSLDLSPWADSPMTQTSISRLFAEHMVLRNLGFKEPDDERCGCRKAVWTGYSHQRRRAIRESAKRAS
jgi:hypothetical protein